MAVSRVHTSAKAQQLPYIVLNQATIVDTKPLGRPLNVEKVPYPAMFMISGGNSSNY